MAQTKRKRRTKHRGNAAGKIEARGRTGRPPTAEELKAARRQQRALKPPTWNGAILRAGFAALLLFVLLMFLDIGPEDPSILSTLALCAFAMLLYIPLGYATDRFVYKRRLRMQQQRKE